MNITDWVNENPWSVWLIVLVFWLIVITAAIAWPRKLPDLDKPEDYGC